MAVTSLIVSADAEAVQVLSRIFQDMEIRSENCDHASAARSRLEEQRFDVLVVDCSDELSAATLISSVRKSPLHHGTVIIALVNSRNRASDVFEKGANLLLYKPVSRERALHSLHAARGLIREERRVQPRIAVHVPASIAYASKEDAAATVVEISESGIGIRTLDDLPKNGKVYFQFALPGQDSLIRLAGEVMWRNASGRVGVRFVNVPETSKKILRRWMDEQSQANSHAPSGDESTANSSVRVSTSLGLLSASAPDRRNLSRRACCLGAEIYREDCTVPHRCSLSDISTGGCYVETTEPFPQGTVLTIVVRTHDLKLCIAGKVQSTHRGFGMGIRFNVNTENERRQVKELIACAETKSKLTT